MLDDKVGISFIGRFNDTMDLESLSVFNALMPETEAVLDFDKILLGKFGYEEAVVNKDTVGGYITFEDEAFKIVITFTFSLITKTFASSSVLIELISRSDLTTPYLSEILMTTRLIEDNLTQIQEIIMSSKWTKL